LAQDVPKDFAMASHEAWREAPPPEALEAARARACATDGGEIWRLLPQRWQPLYEAPCRLDYDAARYDFVAAAREMLECPEDLPLGSLHEARRAPEFEPCPPLRKGMLLAGIPLAREKKGHRSRNDNKKAWTNSPAYQRFVELYRRFLREVVLPELCAAGGAAGGGGALPKELLEAVVQSSPVLRVVMPSAHRATLPHRDADYGHLAEELNFWMPLSPVWDSNSLFVEGFPGRGDYAPLTGGVGHLFRFWGNQCSHYAMPNATARTRVSLDFRVVPKAFWDAARCVGAHEAAAARQKFWPPGELALGCYYRLESAATWPHDDPPEHAETE